MVVSTGSFAWLLGLLSILSCGTHQSGRAKSRVAGDEVICHCHLRWHRIFTLISIINVYIRGHIDMIFTQCLQITCSYLLRCKMLSRKQIMLTFEIDRTTTRSFDTQLLKSNLKLHMKTLKFKVESQNFLDPRIHNRQNCQWELNHS